MVQENAGRGRRYAHLFEWVEGKMLPIFDSPAVGTYPADETVDLKDCPVCGLPMSEHTIDHSLSNTVLNCPAPHRRGADPDEFRPVNEFGMVIHQQTDGSEPSAP
jgi:hypothetical protein